MNTRSFATAGTLLLAALGCREDTESPMEPASPTPQATVAAATALAFHQVSAGVDHSCAVTTDSRAYCWGWNGAGQLGDGTTTRRLTPMAAGAGSTSNR